MLTLERQANIFDSTMQSIVIPVNLVGVMGAGLALQAKRLYPGLLKAYEHACLDHALWDDKGYFIYDVDATRKVICLPTKIHWNEPSPFGLVKTGLFKLAANHEQDGITSIAMPPVGCGHGGLDWEQQIKPLVHLYYGDSIDIPVEVYLPISPWELKG